MKLMILTLSVEIVCLLLGFAYAYLILYTSRLDKWKIQPKRYPIKTFYERLPLILLNIFLLLLVSGVGMLVADHFGIILIEPPAWGLFLWQFLIIIFLDDLFFYFIHRALHENRFLFRKIHLIHHRAHQPIPLEFIYVHPLEWIMGYIGTFIAIVSILFFTPVNAYALWAYIIFRQLHELEIHSGMRYPLLEKIPLLAPTLHHDLHHSNARGNYASTLRIWDRVFQTRIKEKRTLKKLKQKA